MIDTKRKKGSSATPSFYTTPLLQKGMEKYQGRKKKNYDKGLSALESLHKKLVALNTFKPIRTTNTSPYVAYKRPQSHHPCKEAPGTPTENLRGAS
jgi:hypothetical protein